MIATSVRRIGYFLAFPYLAIGENSVIEVFVVNYLRLQEVMCVGKETHLLCYNRMWTNNEMKQPFGQWRALNND